MGEEIRPGNVVALRGAVGFFGFLPEACNDAGLMTVEKVQDGQATLVFFRGDTLHREVIGVSALMVIR